jgi:hypothetical protein
MFFLTLPAAAPTEGACCINGRQTEYRLSERLIEYLDPEGVWQTRPILQRRLCPAGVLYICGDRHGQEWQTDGITTRVNPHTPGSLSRAQPCPTP